MRKEAYIVGIVAVLGIGGVVHKVQEDSSATSRETSLRGPHYEVRKGDGPDILEIDTHISWALNWGTESAWVEDAVNRVAQDCGPITGVKSVKAKGIFRGLTMEVSVQNREQCFPQKK